ncbi:uncharacterized protein LOC9641724 [Selaginella moellendorffii]|nr:uncharacterized protein LOC9641724 [Selaginella moellendorffii]XP_024532316.1 uncharacterized protein LOC9641724 [Selaginella moellendorffii]|eukprot:XP_024532308.1 uncharacterized protein LOC9641724 [Selaginella moellendorffii]
MRIRRQQQQQRMESLSVTVLPATLLQERDSKSSCSEAIPGSLSRSRRSTNWLDKLRASKGFSPEPKVEIEEFVRTLHGNSSGDSKSSGVTATAPLRSSAGNVADCNAASGSGSGTTSEEKLCAVEDKVGFPGGDCKVEDDRRGEAEVAVVGTMDLVQFEQCDSFDPDGSKAKPSSSSGQCMKLSNSSEGLSQVCPSEGSSPEENGKGKSLSPGISNADNGNAIAPAKACGDYDVYAFGLPREDFEPSQGCVTTVKQQQRKQQRKRKQQRPRSCPKTNTFSPGQEVTGPLLQRRNLELLRLGSYCVQERGSPESEKANPVCRTQLALRQEYLTATPLNCSDEKRRSCASLTTSCMEKMRAFSLRSQSSTESDGNGSDSTSDSLTLRRRGMKQSKDLQGAICSKRRKLYAAGAPVTPFQVERTLSLQKDDHLQARRRTPQTNGFFDIASSMLRAPLGVSKTLPPPDDPPDHPASQPKDTLASSVYQVFMKAGKNGLTTREAVSKIIEEKLPGLGECSVVARVEVGKIVRTSPYFMELEESRFVLCSAITGIEDKANNKGPGAEKVKEQVYELQNWAALAVRRARTGKTRRKPIRDRSGLAVSVVGKPGSEENSKAAAPATALQQKQPQQHQQQQQQQQREQEPPRKRRLKSVQQDSTGLGNRCNRSDGKGWHCPLLAQVGYLLCDHHLDRLRAKSGSKARRPNKNRAEKRANNNTTTKNSAGNHATAATNRNSNKGNNNVTTTNTGRGKQGKASHRNGFKAPAPPPPTNPSGREAWGSRQSLGVARVGRGSEKRQKKAEELQDESGGEEVTTFGLRF